MKYLPNLANCSCNLCLRYELEYGLWVKLIKGWKLFLLSVLWSPEGGFVSYWNSQIVKIREERKSV